MELMLLLKAFILGMIEGATEFLPVSSTGHLIIVGDLLEFNDEKSKVFKIFIQLGAILAICWEYRSRLQHIASGAFSDRTAQRFIFNLGVAFMPAALLGLAFHSQIKAYLFSPFTVAIALIVGGFVILIVEKFAPAPTTETVDDMSFMQALKVGCAQSMALIPGVSRSGATILGGVIFGLSRKAATEFSFFVAIPIMFAATTFDLLKNYDLLSLGDVPVFAVGFITSFFAALLAVKTFIRYVAHHDFRLFAYYRIVFGSIVLAYFWNA
ncbi:MAG: undecaprenyl-diphosphatase [Betaproteobacteria bacterium HGW-Betaproteobacteria-1]|jgi:undecaprenyl-diphosphatase|nr:MAG: undecaprenyl-diphosphatase [Betaproteobacteria bacterium HGW-Betaproteobacteria-1]